MENQNPSSKEPKDFPKDQEPFSNEDGENQGSDTILTGKPEGKKKAKKVKTYLLWGIYIFLLIFAFWTGRSFPSTSKGKVSSQIAQGEKQKKIKYWSCSMHPQIQMPGPGKCPICHMDLIPVYEGGGGGGGNERGAVLKLSKIARKLAEINTEPALYRRVYHKLSLVGTIEYDETRLVYLTSRFPGRIDKLYVDFTGTLLRKGDHIASIYSPEFRAAQEELLSNYRSYQQALQSKDRLNIQLEKQKLESSKKKLMLWDLTKEQIEKVLREKKVTDHITIYATTGGTVIHKRAIVGKYIKEGEKLYTLADLKRVWLVMDAYETDLPWLYLGQKVEFQLEAYPGKVFWGRVAFIDPIINPATRTVKVRLDVHNEDLLLKPQMLAKAYVLSLVGSNGRAIDTELAGKFACPMHPYEISLTKDFCPICHMEMVPAEAMRLVRGANQRSRVLTIPATAPLITGKSAVVYVESQEEENIWRYEGRVVTLGPKVVDLQGREYYIVFSGLQEGEKVVIQGNFKIDADLQIKAKPSMMSPLKEREKSKPKKLPPFALGKASYQQDFHLFWQKYMELEKVLAYDDTKAKELPSKTQDLIAILHMLNSKKWKDLPLGARKRLKNLIQELVKRFPPSLKKENYSQIRAAFVKLTPVLEEIVQLFGHTLDGKLYKIHCPMAFHNKGGDWFQISQDVLNPYMGSKMRSCGIIKQPYSPIPIDAIGSLVQVEDSGNPYYQRYFHHLIQKIIQKYLPLHHIFSLKEDWEPKLFSKIQKEAREIQKIGEILKINHEKYFSKEEWQKAEKTIQMMILAARDLRGIQIKALRRDFLDLSEALISLLRTFGHTYGKPLYIYHCPMYRKKLGGDWLQESDQQVENPYMGKKMRSCGSLVETLSPRSKRE